jgi:hypothetical protein
LNVGVSAAERGIASLTTQKTELSVKTTGHIKKGGVIHREAGESFAQNIGVSKENHGDNQISFSTAAMAVSVGSHTAPSVEKRRETTQSSFKRDTCSSMTQLIGTPKESKPVQVCFRSLCLDLFSL